MTTTQSVNAEACAALRNLSTQMRLLTQEKRAALDKRMTHPELSAALTRAAKAVVDWEKKLKAGEPGAQANLSEARRIRYKMMQIRPKGSAW